MNKEEKWDNKERKREKGKEKREKKGEERKREERYKEKDRSKKEWKGMRKNNFLPNKEKIFVWRIYLFNLVKKSISPKWNFSEAGLFNIIVH